MPPRPLISVIVPTHARPESLRACLAGLSALDFPRESFEVIVSDDGSPLSPEPVVAAFHDRIRVTLITHAKSGPASARNRAAATAQGSHLAFLDDDCVPAADWLSVLARQFKPTADVLIGGRVVNALPGNSFAAASQQLVSYLCEYHESRPSRGPFFTSNNMAVHAGLFRDLGGFDIQFPRAAGEDREFCDRWHSRGYRTRYVPEALVYHSHQLTLGRFCGQHFNYGRASLRFHQLRARREGGWIRPEPPAFYLQMLRYPFTQETGAIPWVHAALLGLSQVANAAGAFREGLAFGARRVGGPG